MCESDDHFWLLSPTLRSPFDSVGPHTEGRFKIVGERVGVWFREVSDLEDAPN